MSLKIPSSFTFGVDLSGIPDSYTIGITEVPKIEIDLDPIQIHLDPIEIRPLDLSFRLKEIPSVRAHLPLDYRVCLSVLGFELLGVRLCGEAQVITEPYVPNPCECGYPVQQMAVAPITHAATPQ
ncbi:MAG TPA: hypothetical protein VMU81_24590 [Acetobacteraceae bacterium]|jgi:hypothetical protein|nr:hypothetical protein [Acetobacteraceae bacterium]